MAIVISLIATFQSIISLVVVVCPAEERVSQFSGRAVSPAGSSSTAHLSGLAKSSWTATPSGTSVIMEVSNRTLQSWGFTKRN